jgi:hypothetical protein
MHPLHSAAQQHGMYQNMAWIQLPSITTVKTPGVLLGGDEKVCGGGGPLNMREHPWHQWSKIENKSQTIPAHLVNVKTQDHWSNIDKPLRGGAIQRYGETEERGVNIKLARILLQHWVVPGTAVAGWGFSTGRDKGGRGSPLNRRSMYQHRVSITVKKETGITSTMSTSTSTHLHSQDRRPTEVNI